MGLGMSADPCLLPDSIDWGPVRSQRLAQVPSSTLDLMKQIHVWPNHVRIAHVDLVLVRSPRDTLESTLDSLSRLGFDTRRSNIEIHVTPVAA